jgi:hypothetical protein
MKDIDTVKLEGIYKNTSKKWMGNPPVKCDLCHLPLKGDSFYDFKVPIFGQWGIGCEHCFVKYGGELGTGRGQKYNSKTMEKING